MKKYVIYRTKFLSFMLDRKVIFIWFSFLLLNLLLMIFSIGVGEVKLSPLEVLQALFGYGNDLHNLVVQSFRLPRILLAFLAGAGLAIAGAILQGIIRNPLASPDIIGITGGASLAVVTFFAVFSDRSNSLAVSIQWLPLAAFIGALSVGFLVYVLAWNKGVSPVRLVLIGIGLSEAMKALTNLMILNGPIYLASRAHIWITGSVNGTNWKEVTTLVPWYLFLFLLLFVYIRRINVQELGTEIAVGLGSMIQKERLILLLLCTAIAGGSVAFAGGIGFVGLMAPHIARKLVGSSFGGLLPTSALIGGGIVVGADLIARTAFSPIEVPAGVFTAVIGVPYFIYLLYKQR
ncbi:FecCD family ABC transporter permease [Caldalkalibacillus mannanilyticus]|uniref:FecCD family ABC transporter permease n=1 Tax=Caldalkalibacillus mannanilyticus TaxID=1418 RepID=UPI0004688483|nr:iron ABC transporter permease [Caldalkalibacillus mannanilyticus]